jgi:hypothetical protein
MLSLHRRGKIRRSGVYFVRYDWKLLLLTTSVEVALGES